MQADSFLSRCTSEESPGDRGLKDRERTESENRLSDNRGEDERAETRWSMTKREERSRDQSATTGQSCSLDFGESSK